MAGARWMIGSIALVLAACCSAAHAEPPVLSSPPPAKATAEVAPKPKPGVAVGIVFDTSGSMLKTVADRSGNQTPKHIVAARSLRSIIAKLEAHRKQAGPDKGLDAGLYIFSGRDAMTAVPFGTFDPAKFRAWLDANKQPGGATPLGHALRMESEDVLNSPLENKHVLVVTDGVNTAGPDPAAEMKTIQALASKSIRASSRSRSRRPPAGRPRREGGEAQGDREARREVEDAGPAAALRPGPSRASCAPGQ